MVCDSHQTCTQNEHRHLICANILSHQTKRMTNSISIDYTKRLDTVAYCEDIWIEEDSIWVGENRLAAFTITADYSDDEGNYRVNARRRQDLVDGNSVWIYPRIAGFDTVAECKDFIVEYINTAPCVAIFNDQHVNALDALIA